MRHDLACESSAKRYFTGNIKPNNYWCCFLRINQCLKMLTIAILGVTLFRFKLCVPGQCAGICNNYVQFISIFPKLLFQAHR